MSTEDTDKIVPLPTNEIRIITGLDEGGENTIAYQFKKSGTEDGNGGWQSIDYMTGLGMLEAAKVAFVESFNEED